MNLTTGCPAEQELLLFARGELSGANVETLSAHLSTCEKCESALANLDERNASGAMANSLRYTLERDVAPEEEDLRTLEAWARAVLIDLPQGPTAQGRLKSEPTKSEEAKPLPKLAQYQLLYEIGRGGMGVVYAATHTRLHRPVAVKIILPEYMADSAAAARFCREISMLGELQHANIVAATDAGEVDGRPFLVMELIDGLDLGSLLRRHGPPRVADAAEIIRQASLGLQYLFERGRLHRDLKPSNLMLTADGTIKILDLGLARFFAEQGTGEELTRSNQVLGTYDYMAPEQWGNSRTVDIRADIYSLGCTLFKILTNKVPFADPELQSPPEKRGAHALLPVPNVTRHRPDAPAGLAAVLERMMAKKPGDRYATPGEVAEAIAPFAAGSDCARLLRGAREQVRAASAAEVDVAALAETSGPGRQTPQSSASPGQPDLRAPARRRRWWIAIALAAPVAMALAALLLPRTPTNADKDKVLQPGVWHDLLREPPEKLFWNNAQHNHFFDFSPKLKELTLDVPSISLLQLGTAERAGFRIRLGIRQTRWVGGVGLFLGYRDDAIAGKSYKRFQFFELSPYKNSPNEAFMLVRGTALLEKTPDRLQYTSEGAYAKTSLTRPNDREECTLEIAVNKHGLLQALWNTRECSELSKFEKNQKFEAVDYLGPFGVFCRRSQGRFGNAQYLLFDKDTP